MRRRSSSARHAMQPTDQLQVLAAGQQVLDGDLLHGEADPPPDGAGLRGDIETQHARPTGGRPKERGQDADRRRLAGAVGPQEGEELTPFDGHVDAVEGSGPAGIDLDQRFDLDGRCGWAAVARYLHQNGFTTISQMMTSRPAMPRTAPMVGRDDVSNASSTSSAAGSGTMPFFRSPRLGMPSASRSLK